MKKIAFITTSIITIVSLTGCNKNKQIYECAVPNCGNYCENLYGLYCPKHTCQKEDCFEKKWEDDEFCVKHEYSNSTSDTTLFTSPDSITKAREVVNDYCNNLLSKHSYIKSINVGEEYDVTNLYIVFHCNVIQKDNKVRPASIYVLWCSDNSFKVNELIYD